MELKDLLLNNLNEQINKSIAAFVNEPLAFKLDAEPGWRVAVYVPVGPDITDILLDIIPIKQWGFFSSLRLLQDNAADTSTLSLLRRQQEATQPLIPSDYNGILFKHINDMRIMYPNWNNVPPPTMVYGCLSPSDNRTVEDIIPMCKAYINKAHEYANSVLKTDSGYDLESLGQYGLKTNKDKLN